MKIGGLVKNSLIDFPGRPAAVVFTQGCSWRCPYCHNFRLMSEERLSTISESAVFELMQGRPAQARNLVVSGGEPTQQLDLIQFLEKAAEKKISVKLDTNGASPEVLAEILSRQLVDYVAMDFKGPLDRYTCFSGKAGSADHVSRSIDLLNQDTIDYEFRTTVVPLLHEPSDFAVMGKHLRFARRLVLQPFRGRETFCRSLQSAPEPSETYMEECAKAAEPWLPVFIR